MSFNMYNFHIEHTIHVGSAKPFAPERQELAEKGNVRAQKTASGMMQVSIDHITIICVASC